MSSSIRLTARKRLASTLAEEILNHPGNETFLMPSEYTLCQRFNISRVTVRLALSDLERKGLIFRKHGKGTFAHGRSSREQKGLALWVGSSENADSWPISELVRGMQSYGPRPQSPITFFSSSPSEWGTELSNSLAGVVILGSDVSNREMEVLKNRKLPLIFISDATSHSPRIALGLREAARTMTQQLLDAGHRRLALISGYQQELDSPKRLGVHQALFEAGLDPCRIQAVPVGANEELSMREIRSLLNQPARPTGWIAFDDSFAAMLNFCARREGLRIPDDISVVSFHDLPYLRYHHPVLTTAGFEFFNAGRKAAEMLHQSFLTGEEIKDVCLQPTYRIGQSVGANRNFLESSSFSSSVTPAEEIR